MFRQLKHQRTPGMEADWRANVLDIDRTGQGGVFVIASRVLRSPKNVTVI